MISTSITCALMASFAMFPTVFKIYEKRWTFSLKRTSQKNFFIKKFVIDTIKISCQPRVYNSGRPILKLLAQLLPELYSTRSN